MVIMLNKSPLVFCNRIVPHRIQHHPDVVMDVILSTNARSGLADGLSREDITVSTFSGYSMSSSSSGTPFSNLSLMHDVAPVQAKTLEIEVEQRLFTALSSESQLQVRESSSGYIFIDQAVQAIKEGQTEQSNQLSKLFLECFQQLKAEMTKNTELTARILQMQEEMKELQKQALNRLALLQNSVQALLTQTYELHEYPIPRLFVVLPQDSSGWDSLNPFANKFRLYFLCECGEHTKPTNSKIPHHIHLAKHEGYDIARPTEFFQQYGSYVLTILRMLKFGISVAGVVIPTASLLVPDEAVKHATASLKMLAGNIQSGMDQVIGYIEKVSNEGVDDTTAPTGNEALEGADLRKLDAFLKGKDGNKTLGNLYRTVTADGHVKWVCIDHYRENYQEKAAQLFREMVKSLNGSFDEDTGRVCVRLDTRVLAERFYIELANAKSVYELEIQLLWDTTANDFKDLRDTLCKTNVGVLQLELYDSKGPASDILKRNRRYDPILDIMRHPSIKSFTLQCEPQEFFDKCSLLTRKDHFSNLKLLNIRYHGLRKVIPSLKCLISKAPNLTRLNLTIPKVMESESVSVSNSTGTFMDELPLIHNAIVEHQTFPIVLGHHQLHILPLMGNTRQPSTGTLESVNWFRVYGKQIEMLHLNGIKLSDADMEAFAEATLEQSNLKELNLGLTWRDLSEQSVRNLGRIVARSELRRLEIRMHGAREQVYILESIQWKHIRELKVIMSQIGQLMSVATALMNSMKVISEDLMLEVFRLQVRDKIRDITFVEEELLLAFLSPLKLKHLELGVALGWDQVVDLLESIDVTRLQDLHLRGFGFGPDHVQELLDNLQHATELETVCLEGASITAEHEDQMKAQGVTLKK